MTNNRRLLDCQMRRRPPPHSDGDDGDVPSTRQRPKRISSRQQRRTAPNINIMSRWCGGEMTLSSVGLVMMLLMLTVAPLVDVVRCAGECIWPTNYAIFRLHMRQRKCAHAQTPRGLSVPDNTHASSKHRRNVCVSACMRGRSGGRTNVCASTLIIG